MHIIWPSISYDSAIHSRLSTLYRYLMKKKVDSRIQILIENIIKLNQRGMFVIIGDRGKD